MEGWPEICIADGPLLIIDGDRGKNYPTQGDFFDSGYCLFLNAGNVTSNGFSFSNRAFVTRERDELLNKGRLRRQDSVLTTRGTVGNVAFFGNDVEYDNLRINSGMVILRPDQHKLDSYFLYLFLRSSLFDEQVKGLTSGSAQPQLPIRDIRRVRLALPPLPEQRAIAAVLSALDDKIELNRRMNETLEAMARALFRDWFVDFGPTRAKMAQSATESVTESGIGAKPQTDPTAPYLSPALWSLFPDRLDDAGKPEGWEVRRIEQVLELAYGKALKSTNRTPGAYPVYGSGGVTGSHSEALVQGPSVVVGRKGSVGTLYWEDRPFFPIDTVFYVRPIAPLSFCYLSLDRLGLKTMNTDAAVPGLNRNNVYRLEIAWPGEKLVLTFDRIYHEMRAKITLNTKESRTLAQTRDLLLPRLMSGELRLAEAARAVEEVL